jgi:hypothetical protein
MRADTVDVLDHDTAADARRAGPIGQYAQVPAAPGARTDSGKIAEMKVWRDGKQMNVYIEPASSSGPRMVILNGPPHGQRPQDGQCRHVRQAPEPDGT